MPGRRVHHRLDLIPVAQVALNNHDRAAQFLRDGCRLVGALPVAVHHGDPGRVLPGHLADDAPAEALSGASDDRDLVVEHACLLRLVPPRRAGLPATPGSLPRRHGPLRSRGPRAAARARHQSPARWARWGRTAPGTRQSRARRSPTTITASAAIRLIAPDIVFLSSAQPSPAKERAVNGRTSSGAPRSRAMSCTRPSAGSDAPNAAPGVTTVILGTAARTPNSTALAQDQLPKPSSTISRWSRSASAEGPAAIARDDATARSMPATSGRTSSLPTASTTSPKPARSAGPALVPSRRVTPRAASSDAW